MVDDIRIATSFRGHRKRKKANLLFGLKPSATDYLLDLWIATAQNHPNGVLAGMDETDIALEAGWGGDPKAFVEDLKAAGFLELCEGGYRIHDWEEHQPWVVGSKERSERARKAAVARWDSKADAQSMPDACGEHTEGNAPFLPTFPYLPTSPASPTSPNPTGETDPMRLSRLLFSLMQGNDPKTKEPNFEKWAIEVDRLIRIDGRTPEEIEKVVRFSQSDPFWLTNIRSAKTLREKFSQLFLKMSNGKKNRGSEDGKISSKDFGSGTPADQLPGWARQ